MTGPGRHVAPEQAAAATRAEFDALVEEMESVWRESVDDLDASVALEAAGINDAVAAARYGVHDVHELAGRVIAEVPTRISGAARVRKQASIAYVRLACRGLLFGIPGLFYLVVARAHSGPATSYTLVVSMLTAWGLSQSVAVVAYRVLGRGGRRSASVALGWILIGTFGVAALSLAIVASMQALYPGVLAIGQLLYVLAATVLLFYDADRLLAASLVPGAGVCLAYLAGAGIPAGAAMGAVGMTVLLACAAAWLAAHTAAQGTGLIARPCGRDVLDSGPFVLNGVLTGLSVAYVPIRMIVGADSSGIHTIDLTIVPLVLSMGFAEIELLKLRATGDHLMHMSLQLQAYRRGAVWMVARSQLRFLLVLGVVSAVVAVVIRATTGFASRDFVLLCAYSVLGTALLAGLMLVALDRVRSALYGFIAAAALFGAGALGLHLAGLHLSVECGYLVLCALLLGCLSVPTFRTLQDPFVLA